MKPIKPDPHAEIERLALAVVEQSLAIDELENGTAKYRWTNVGRYERQRRQTVARLRELMKETA